jgi:hypothetical protein
VSKRFLFAAAFLASVVLGLASRKIPGIFPPILGKYPGDALWAIMVFCAWGVLLPRSTTAKLALYALLTSYADEFSQMYQADWINRIRSTPVGQLVLGSAFSWFDMLAYTVGIALVVAGKIILGLFRS